MGGDAAGVWPEEITILVLSGGASRRLGRDKATTHVGGTRLVDRLLQAIPDTIPAVLVGPPVAGLPRQVRTCREDPPGSGPLAGIGAGLGHVGTPVVGIIAADMPFAVPVLREALAALVAQPSPSAQAALAPPSLPRAVESGLPAAGSDSTSGGGADCGSAPAVGGEAGGDQVAAVVPVDPQGHPHPLCAAYRTADLGRALASLGALADQPVRAVLPLLRVMEWAVPAAGLADVDTPEGLGDARLRAAEEVSDMQEWVTAVREALAIDVEVDIDAVLDVARDAAHGVQRPAAPVTTFLMGVAVAGGADPKQVAATIAQLAAGWAPTQS